MATTVTPDQDQNTDLDSGQSAWDEIVNRPDMKALDDQMGAEAREMERGRLNNQEDNPDQPKSDAGGESFPPDSAQGSAASGKDGKRQGRFRTFLKDRKTMSTSLGIGGAGGIVLLLIMAMLPMKLEALIKNAADAAAKIPGYALEQRVEYLVTRALATRALMLVNKSSSEDAGKVVFCGNPANISCSIFTTMTADYIEKQLGYDLKPSSNGVDVEIVPSGRRALGGAATKWVIQLSDADLDNYGVDRVIKRISSHKEMRAYLKEVVDTKMKNRMWVTRFIARKILMKKYGVKNWRALESLQDAIDTKVGAVKSAMTVAIYKNTIGKVAPRISIYMACIVDSSAINCQKILDAYTSNLSPPDKNDEKYKKDPALYEKDLKRYEQLSTLKGKILGEIPDTGVTGVIKKIISSTVLKVAGAAAGIVMLIDGVLSAIYAVDSGVLDVIGADIVSMAYVGFTYGEVSGIVTNWEKIKTNTSGQTIATYEVMQELAELIECDGNSPLCAKENGYLEMPGATDSASNSGYEVYCAVNGVFVKTILEPGQLICANQRVYRNYTKLFKDNPAFAVGAQIAKVWVESPAHDIIKIANSVVDAVLGPMIQTFFGPILGELTKFMEPFIAMFFSLIFDPPPTGYEANGTSNYVAVSGAMHIEQVELMKYGVEQGNALWGGGGKYLSIPEATAVAAVQDQEAASEYAAKPWYEKLFNPTVKGSVAQLALLQAPSDTSEVLTLPGQALASLTSPLSVKAATTVTINPFNLGLYGYPANDPVFTQEPSVYTDEACEVMRQKRVESLEEAPAGENYPLPVYTVTDPCALEKLATGSIVTPTNPTAKGAFVSAYEGLNDGSAAAPVAGAAGSCPDGTSVVAGVTRGWIRSGAEQAITLCSIPGTQMSIIPHWAADPQYQGTSAAGVKTLAVHSSAAGWLLQAAQKASSEGVTLSGSIGYRSLYEQCSILKKPTNLGANAPAVCPSWVTPVPGNWSSTTTYSNHMMGYSIDFYTAGENWMRNCMRNNTDGTADNRCFGFYDDVMQRDGWDSAHFTFEPVTSAAAQ